MNYLQKEDFNLILEALTYSKKKFVEYQGYPSEEFRAQRIAAINNVIDKIKEELKDWGETGYSKRLSQALPPVLSLS